MNCINFHLAPELFAFLLALVEIVLQLVYVFLFLGIRLRESPHVFFGRVVQLSEFVQLVFQLLHLKFNTGYST